MKKKLMAPLLLVGLAFPVSLAIAQPASEPTGTALLGEASAKVAPLGFEAYTIFQTLKNQSFDQNVAFSNSWIKAQLNYFDGQAKPEYKTALAPMINGGGEHGLGMRNWLTDSHNVAWWDNAVKQSVGEEGYARVVALNAAFAPGSKDYLLTYGYDRKYIPATDTMVLNNLEIPGVMKAARFSFSPGTSAQDTFPQLVKSGDVVRKQMLDFYESYADGNTTRNQVEAFNTAYVKAGGCALAATEEESSVRAQRYLNALNLLSKTLDEMGFKPR